MNETISELIQRRLRELNLSKAEVAKRVGVSRAYIGDLANGTAKTQSGFYRPKPEILARIAATLDVSESEILDALGYATHESKPARKPQNVAEFFEILDKMGIDVQFDGGYRVLETLDADDLQELVDAMTATALAKVKRKKSR